MVEVSHITHVEKTAAARKGRVRKYKNVILDPTLCVGESPHTERGEMIKSMKSIVYIKC